MTTRAETSAQAKADQRMVTVCSHCLTAACWQGEFYCDRYKSAGTVQRTVAELRGLALESPDYWKEDR